MQGIPGGKTHPPMPFKRLPARGMGPLGGFERAATPARLRARPVHFKSKNVSALGAGLTKYPSAPRGSPKVRRA